MKNNYSSVIFCDVFMLHIQHALHTIEVNTSLVDWWTPYSLDFGK